jgi:hypothetical protein
LHVDFEPVLAYRGEAEAFVEAACGVDARSVEAHGGAALAPFIEQRLE